jgi:TetR/AcrR family tetracycline transcriptional repressor
LDRKHKGRSAHATKARQTPLTRNDIIAAALARVDRYGLEGFSIREVARDLGVYPTALYWHARGGRNEILGAIAATAMRDVAPAVEDVTDWREWLSQLFQRYREALHRHPNIAPLLGAQLVSNAGVDPVLVERVLAILERAGFSDVNLVNAYNAVIAAMIGFVTLELAPMPGEDPAGWADAVRQQIEGFSPQEFPILTRYRDRLADRGFILRWTSGSRVPLDGGFDVFVRAMIQGLDHLVRSAGEAERVPALL